MKKQAKKVIAISSTINFPNIVTFFDFPSTISISLQNLRNRKIYNKILHFAFKKSLRKEFNSFKNRS